ncbi:MAG: S9 family peptidase [Gemmatimonadales bacterium]
MALRTRPIPLTLAALLTTLPAVAQQQPAAPPAQPPVAAVRPTQLEKHGHVRVDDYYWLRERADSEVIRYLEAENAYTQAVMAHTEALQERLFEEIQGRIKQTDASVPYRQGRYYYYTRFEEGKSYPIYARKRVSLDAREEIMLDANELARDKPFLQVMGWDVSSGEDLLAFAVDTVGRRIATIRIKNLASGQLLPDVIPNVTGNLVWAEDHKTLFYTKQDPVTLRRNRIYRHVLGRDPATDQLVYEERDEEFSTYVFKTKSRRYVMIGSSQTMADEYRYLDARQPMGAPKVFLPRRRGREYSVEHFGDWFYVRTNDEARNFRLMRTPVDSTGRQHWQEVIPHRDDVLLQGFEIFKDHLVIAERQDGLVRLRIRPWADTAEHYVDFGEPAYFTYISTNPEFDTPLLRYGYSSLTTPSSTYDYNMETREKTLLKREEVLGGFDPANYVSERLYATARDGTRVPVSLVYRKGMERRFPAPTLLYGYGSYGSSSEATFSSLRLSLLDRGFVYAIAHVRGGQELGRRWYEDGKLLNKKNTFTDFVDVAEHLVAQRYTTPDRLFAQGGSAGGLLIGAVVNLRPELVEGAIAAVPFVDVVTTMLDASIPLTTSEYDEWGNPNDSTYYRYMLSYSPYDNVERKAYPHLLVTAGLHDSQVQYFEPAKWVAKLRAMRTGENRLLLKTNMEAGHGGASGRYRRWREIAFQYAFLLDLAGLADAPIETASP